MTDILKYICSVLDEENIQYMISGSFAMNLYTIPRMTRDIDIVIHIETEKVDSFLNRLGINFYYNKEAIKIEVQRHGMFNIIETNSGIKIDFIVRKTDEYRLVEFDRRKKTSAYGFDTWVVSPEDLILSKLIWCNQLRSDRHIDDISNLLEYEHLDKDYVLGWIKKMNLNSFMLL